MLSLQHVFTLKISKVSDQLTWTLLQLNTDGNQLMKRLKENNGLRVLSQTNHPDKGQYKTLLVFCPIDYGHRTIIWNQNGQES